MIGFQPHVLILPPVEGLSVIPARRHTSTTATPTSTCFNTPTICSTEKRFLLTANLPSSGQILPETNSQCVLRIGGPIMVLRTLQPVYTSPVYCQVRSALTVYIIGTRASGYLSWSGVDDSTKAKYISADQLPLFVFRLQLCGGPYIPIIPFSGPIHLLSS